MAVPDLVVELLEAEVHRLRGVVETQGKALHRVRLALDTVVSHAMAASRESTLEGSRVMAQRARERAAQALADLADLVER